MKVILSLTVLAFILMCSAVIAAPGKFYAKMPKDPPVSATQVLSCKGVVLITVLTYADGSVIRVTKSDMHGFKDNAEVDEYGNQAGHNAIQFSELCGGTTS